jgi:hypothetical protein
VTVLLLVGAVIAISLRDTTPRDADSDAPIGGLAVALALGAEMLGSLDGAGRVDPARPPLLQPGPPPAERDDDQVPTVPADRGARESERTPPPSSVGIGGDPDVRDRTPADSAGAPEDPALADPRPLPSSTPGPLGGSGGIEGVIESHDGVLESDDEEMDEAGEGSVDEAVPEGTEDVGDDLAPLDETLPPDLAPAEAIEPEVTATGYSEGGP